MVIEIKYYKSRSRRDPDFLRTEEVIRGETFSETLEKLCENWVIEPQVGILTEIEFFRPPKLYPLIYCAFAPHPVMNVNFANKQEVRTLFDNLFKPVAMEEGDYSVYKPMVRIDRMSETRFSTLFLVSALYYISERSIDEVRRSFEKYDQGSGPCEGRLYVFD